MTGIASIAGKRLLVGGLGMSRIDLEYQYRILAELTAASALTNPDQKALALEILRLRKQSQHSLNALTRLDAHIGRLGALMVVKVTDPEVPQITYLQVLKAFLQRERNLINQQNAVRHEFISTLETWEQAFLLTDTELQELEPNKTPAEIREMFVHQINQNRTAFEDVFSASAFVKPEEFNAWCRRNFQNASPPKNTWQCIIQ